MGGRRTVGMSGTRISGLWGKITILLIICCFGMVALFVNTASALSGSGTQQDPWRIESLVDFNEFVADANYWDGWTRLETDVNLAGFTYTTAVIAPDVNNTNWWFDGTAFTGVFDGNDHKITNLTIDDGGAGNDFLSLFGFIVDGEVSNLGLEGGSISGEDYVSGLVGYNKEGSVSNCYSTASVSGGSGVGGLVVVNVGCISNCYSTGNVNGADYVGGLVGWNQAGNISNCYSTGNVRGVEYVGGLVGSNSGSISPGCISNCYSTGSVTGNSDVGGLVGWNYRGVITDSFWDIETSGQTTSASGTGLPTAEMQTESTFTDAGWDFVGETANGIEDTWFIPQQDYPHLWWEGMQVPMKLTPRTLNCRSKGNWVKAHLTLPEGFTVEDVDSNRPAVLHSFGFESAPLYVSVNENERVQIEAAFEREAVCSLTGDWPQALTVAGFLTDGNIFLGTSKVRMITPGLKEIEELALYWLNADCVQPDFCDGVDLNRDSLVNLLDYALLQNSQVEFVSE